MCAAYCIRASTPEHKHTCMYISRAEDGVSRAEIGVSRAVDGVSSLLFLLFFDYFLQYFLLIKKKKQFFVGAHYGALVKYQGWL